MASFSDFDFTGDDNAQGVDTDPTPDQTFDWERYLDEAYPDPNDRSVAEDAGIDGIEDDATNYVEPGAGDTFAGQDPTVFAAEGDPDEPTAQTSDVPPVEAEQQTAPAVNDPKTLGQKDDPEAREQAGDQQAGDVEDDDADPADVSSAEGDVDAFDDVDFPEQGIRASETWVEIPRSTQAVSWNRVFPGLRVQELRIDPRLTDPLDITLFATEPFINIKLADANWWLGRGKGTLYDEQLRVERTLARIRDEFDASRRRENKANRMDLDALQRFEKKLDKMDDVDWWDWMDYFDADGDADNDGVEDDFDVVPDDDGEDIGELDLVTTPTTLADMGDVEGLIDNDTFLNEFQNNNADTI